MVCQAQQDVHCGRVQSIPTLEVNIYHRKSVSNCLAAETNQKLWHLCIVQHQIISGFTAVPVSSGIPRVPVLSQRRTPAALRRHRLVDGPRQVFSWFMVRPAVSLLARTPAV